MDNDTLEKMFDPFYSTKPVGQGTGLGLSMVQGFVEQSRGTIIVDSTPGEGTRIRLYFPALDEADLPAPEKPAGFASPPAGHDKAARVLLVEDQESVRTVVERMLQSDGYQVQTATSGDEAFEMCASGGAFDLVITDIVMPGDLQGPELATALRDRDPRLCFLFITGYDSASSARDVEIGTDVSRLMKPFSKQQLLDAVAGALNH